jgi:hypothetical protein
MDELAAAASTWAMVVGDAFVRRRTRRWRRTRQASTHAAKSNLQLELLLRRWRWIPKVKDPTLPVAKSGMWEYSEVR